MHYSAAPCEPAKTSAGCRATHQYVLTLTVHTNTSNLTRIRRLTSATSMTNNYPVVVMLRDGQHRLDDRKIIGLTQHIGVHPVISIVGGPMSTAAAIVHYGRTLNRCDSAG